jgi:hypothetical protein
MSEAIQFDLGKEYANYRYSFVIPPLARLFCHTPATMMPCVPLRLNSILQFARWEFEWLCATPVA